MKKPVVLIVDDDPAVLAALHAEVLQRLGDVCRIETFERAQDVIEMLPSWEAENRAIAVAVVDQKMPRLSGVELIERLRTSTPGATLQAVLLTGYGGLDSALDAVNRAGVARYLEKPWSATDLDEAVRSAFTAFLIESEAGYHYVFRELSTDHDIAAALRLRYEVYSATASVRQVLPTSPEERMDVDPYDAVSRQFGLMACSPRSETVIGALRVAGDEPAPALKALERVLAGVPSLIGRLHTARRVPLPLMTYLVDSDAVGRIVDEIDARGERVVEPGRLSLEPRYRAAAPGRERHLARHVIDGAVAFYFFHLGIGHAILTCIPPQDAFYRPYGFSITEGTLCQFHDRLGAQVACLHGTIPGVPAPARERCTALAARIARTGGACRCASFPECLGGPYETGDFSAADVFCPLLACQQVGAAQT